MTIQVPYRIVLLVALGAVLGACHRVPQHPRDLLQPVNPFVQRESYGADLSAYTAILIIMEPYAGAPYPYGYELTADTLRRELVDNLVGQFAVGESQAPSGKTLEARVRITELNYVSGGGRATAGIFAGRATLNVSLELRDKDSGKVLDTLRANHASSHAAGVFGATTGRQITAIAKEFSSRIVAAKSRSTDATAVTAPATRSSPLHPTAGGVEVMFWESIRDSITPADFRAYLEQYPQGQFAVLARNRLTKLEAK